MGITAAAHLTGAITMADYGLVHALKCMAAMQLGPLSNRQTQHAVQFEAGNQVWLRAELE